MTLKEKLDEKLPSLSSVIWKEIQSLFLELDSDTLAKGVIVSIFIDASKTYFLHLVESVSDSKLGTRFSYDFNIDTLKEVISIAEENGLVVETVIKDSFYKLIYTPSWK